MGHSHSVEQRTRLAPIVLGVVPFILASLHILALPLWLPVRDLASKMVTDDSFYYLKIARYLALEGRQTFDGLNWTNGYHPLWGWTLAGGLLPVRHQSLDFLFRYSLFLNGIVMVVAGFLFCFAFRRWFPRDWVWGLPLFAGFCFFPNYYLMECGLFLLLIAVSILSMPLPGERPSRYGDCLLFGLALGGLILSRLDGVFTALALYAFPFFLFLARREYSRMRGLIAGGMITAAMVLGWAGWTWAVSGHPATISGSLKLASHPVITSAIFHQDWVGVYGAVALFLSAGILLMFVRLLCVSGKEIGPAWGVAAALAAGNVAQFLFQAILVDWGKFGWAGIHFRLMFPMLFIFLCTVLRNRPRMHSLAMAGGLIVICALAFLHSRQLRRDLDREPKWVTAAYDGALWARAALPSDAILAMKDTGTFGYFSDRRVVNLDGLVNSWEYQEVLKRQGLNDYLREEGVGYLVEHAAPASAETQDFRMKYVSHLHDCLSDEIVLNPERLVYWREYTLSGQTYGFGVWRLAP